MSGQVPAGWSKAARRRAPRTTGPCYYCGVVDCDDCGQPPAMLTALAQDDDSDGDDDDL